VLPAGELVEVSFWTPEMSEATRRWDPEDNGEDQEYEMRDSVGGKNWTEEP
jgi:hypothetical protein